VLRSYAFWDGLQWLGPNLISLIWIFRRICTKSGASVFQFLVGLARWWLAALTCRLPDRARRYQSFREQAFRQWESRLLDSISHDYRNGARIRRLSAKAHTRTPRTRRCLP